MSADTPEFPTSITFTPNASALTFYGGDTRVWLTISPDGVMAVGSGLSEDDATQRIAKMLAERYSQLHKDQADALAAKDTALSEMRAQLERARKALEPFAAYARLASFGQLPADMPLTRGSGMAARQVTVGDFRAAARAASQDDGEER